jgi:tRNA(Ile)-lysidine synthase
MDYLSGNIIRPFLDCKKEEIESYLSTNEIPYCIDSTNKETCADRNRVRLELLPSFQRLFGRNVSGSIIKTRDLCLQDADYLDGESSKLFLSLASEDSLPCGALCGLHPAMMSRVIRDLYENVKGDKNNLSLKQTESIIRITKKNRNGTSVDLSDGYCAVISKNRLFIKKQDAIHESLRLKAEAKDAAASICIPLVIPARRYEKEIGISVTTKFIDDPQKILVENPDEVDYNAMTWYFPYENVKGCVWRFRKEGDWIRPNRNSGKKTLRKYLIDRKIPADGRDRLLLLAKGSEILWIPEIMKRRSGKLFFPMQDLQSKITGEQAEFISVEVEYRS